MPRYIGKEMGRVDGVAKVTGRAKYAAEFAVPNLAYGFIVLGSVAKGTIKTIDTQEAERATGVVRVFTHLNTPKLATKQVPPEGAQEKRDKSFRALQSDRIFFNAQPVALVVAETYEQGALRGAPGQSHLQRGEPHDRHRGGARPCARARRGAAAAVTRQPRGGDAQRAGEDRG
jgi:xanthine dehydrogenase YagR molybdenum-binding subunit